MKFSVGSDGGRMRAAGASLLAVFLLSCSGGAAETTTTAGTPPTTVATTTTPEATTTTEAEPELISEELEGFEPRSVTYANVEFTVTGAQLSNQELRSYAEAGDPVVDEDNFYAYLDITALNQMTSTMADGLDAEVYSLQVGDQRYGAAHEMTFLSEVSGLIVEHAAVDTFLAFPIDEGFDLGAAGFVIGIPPDRPATLPLTGPVPEPVYPVAVELEASAEGVGPTNGSQVLFTVLGAGLYEDRPHEHSNSPTGLRADEGELFLVVNVRAENLGGGPELLSGDAFRLLVDGVPRQPWDVADDPVGSPGAPSVSEGTATDCWVAFLVPSDATEVVLEVGDFEAEPGQIPLDVPLEG